MKYLNFTIILLLLNCSYSKDKHMNQSNTSNRSITKKKTSHISNFLIKKKNNYRDIKDENIYLHLSHCLSSKKDEYIENNLSLDRIDFKEALTKSKGFDIYNIGLDLDESITSLSDVVKTIYEDEVKKIEEYLSGKKIGFDFFSNYKFNLKQTIKHIYPHLSYSSNILYGNNSAISVFNNSNNGNNYTLKLTCDRETSLNFYKLKILENSISQNKEFLPDLNLYYFKIKEKLFYQKLYKSLNEIGFDINSDRKELFDLYLKLLIDNVNKPILISKSKLYDTDLSKYVLNNMKNKINYKKDFYDNLLWIKKILSGLIFLHKQGFHHGDIKPANIFINKNSSTDRSKWDLIISDLEEDSDTENLSFNINNPHLFVNDLYGLFSIFISLFMTENKSLIKIRNSKELISDTLEKYFQKLPSKYQILYKEFNKITIRIFDFINDFNDDTYFKTTDQLKSYIVSISEKLLKKIDIILNDLSIENIQGIKNELEKPIFDHVKEKINSLIDESLVYTFNKSILIVDNKLSNPDNIYNFTYYKAHKALKNEIGINKKNNSQIKKLDLLLFNVFFECNRYTKKYFDLIYPELFELCKDIHNMNDDNDSNINFFIKDNFSKIYNKIKNILLNNITDHIQNQNYYKDIIPVYNQKQNEILENYIDEVCKFMFELIIFNQDLDDNTKFVTE